MSEGTSRQSIVDEEHLKLLSLGYKISAAISGFFSLFGFIYVFAGIAMSVAFSHAADLAVKTDQAPPAFVGWIFAGFGALFILLMATMALLKLRAAFCIQRRKSRTYCMVISAIICIGVPYGTALGVASFMVLGRDSVAQQFNSGAAPQPVS
jgi:hypothetical protein